MLVVNEVDDWCPGILVVYVVTETRSVDHRELDLEGLFFELGLDDLDLGELVELLDVSAPVVFCGGQLGRKERVDQSGLAQAGFTNNHDGEVGSLLCNDFVPLVGQISDANASRTRHDVKRDARDGGKVGG